MLSPRSNERRGLDREPTLGPGSAIIILEVQIFRPDVPAPLLRAPLVQSIRVEILWMCSGVSASPSLAPQFSNA
jgi:hypothetical protein